MIDEGGNAFQLLQGIMVYASPILNCSLRPPISCATERWVSSSTPQIDRLNRC
jgi:hypothetical protein